MNTSGYIEYMHNVFYVKVLGPWNYETFEHYNNDFNKLLIGNKCPSYSVFAVLEGDSLMIPEVCETFKKATTKRIATGLKHVAFYLSKSACPNAFKQQFHDLYQNKNINFKFFNDIDSAKSWLKTYEIILGDKLVNKLLYFTRE
ncbi:hypothetical protein CWB72_17875 [Pseudoalteromonas phenolica]|uniref:hypothetical protein n=1 Tax=Pseudoalteromonas phenolica TaxID=161398 RepID=UPI00110BC0D0|nr:hypothetical protein [Pseudoalteromonas phenolica]TMN86856.1 hypothetical protein CWB72_17875 [Pseudoalteromonas phenolica]